MNLKRPIGITIFAICYFLLAILFFYMVFILLSGKLDWALHSPYTGKYTSFEDKLFSSTIFVVIPGLWYLASSVLLYRLNSWGRWLPVPLVLICGILGMYVLFPLLIAHIIYFNRQNVKEQLKAGEKMKIDAALKLSLIIAVLIISLSIAYYYMIFLPKATSVDVPISLKSTTEPADTMIAPPRAPIGLKGTIIQVNDAERFVVINLGEASGLRAGAQMTVLRDGNQIGTVTIIETRREISAADIVHLVSGFTIQADDTVASK